jgi:hypothetical protein
VAATITPLIGIHGVVSAALAIAFAIHGLAIFLVLVLGDIVRWQVGWRLAKDHVVPSRLQFGVGGLLMWVAISAILLGLCQTAIARLAWTPDELSDWHFFLPMATIGLYNATLALAVLIPLTGSVQRLPRRVLASVVLLVAIAWSEPHVLASLPGFVNSDPAHLWPLAGYQVLFFCGTLLLLRLATRSPP